MFIMARSRKYTHKAVLKLTRQQILMIEDEWWDKYNKETYKRNTNIVG